MCVDTRFLRYGDAYWTMASNETVVAAGTLLVSDLEAERYCVEPGEYTLRLADSVYFEAKKRHAKVTFSGCGVAVTLDGYTASTATVLVMPQDSSSGSKGSKMADRTKIVIIVVSVCVAAAVIVAVVLLAR